MDDRQLHDRSTGHGIAVVGLEHRIAECCPYGLNSGNGVRFYEPPCIVKNGGGQVYWPEYGIDNIGYGFMQDRGIRYIRPLPIRCG